MSRIVIIGGHGKIALHLAGILTERGDEVTSIIRNPSQSGDVSATGAMPAVTDIERLDVSELAKVLAGHDVVVWSAGAGGGDLERTYAVDRDAAIRSMDAAEQAGVPRYIMVSYLGARTDHGVAPDSSFFPYAEAKAAADDHLRGTSLDWTILGPGALTLEPATGHIDVGAEPSGNEVSRQDVAMVAAETIATPQTVGKTIPFVGGSTPIPDAVRDLD